MGFVKRAFFRARRFAISLRDLPTQLAEWLTERTWTLCTGFAIGNYLFLNDATSEDGGQEYAVVKKPATAGEPYLQVESITMSWCSKEEALTYVEKALAGGMDGEDFIRVISPRLQSPSEHGRCPHCA